MLDIVSRDAAVEAPYVRLMYTVRCVGTGQAVDLEQFVVQVVQFILSPRWEYFLHEHPVHVGQLVEVHQGHDCVSCCIQGTIDDQFVQQPGLSDRGGEGVEVECVRMGHVEQVAHQVLHPVCQSA